MTSPAVFLQTADHQTAAALRRWVSNEIQGYELQKFDLWLSGFTDAWKGSPYPSIPRDQQGNFRCGPCDGYGHFAATMVLKNPVTGKKRGACEHKQACGVCVGFGVPLYRLREFSKAKMAEGAA
jgi:hypothetical protein